MSMKPAPTELYTRIEDDFKARLPGYHKSRGRGLCLLAALMLDVRSVNLMELASALPRKIVSKDKRYQYIERQLANNRVDCDEVMEAYASQLFKVISLAGTAYEAKTSEEEDRLLDVRTDVLKCRRLDLI